MRAAVVSRKSQLYLHMRFYGRDARVQSVTIEVRRDLYVDGLTGERLPGFATVWRVLTEFRAPLEAWSLARGPFG